MKVIIIEDEERTANELKNMLLGIDGDIQVEVILGSVAAALAWFEQNPMPELIFSDIELGDGLSFEVFKKISIEVPVIFCTAFDEYAIRAFESNGIDYLLKPIDEYMLQKSVEKYLRFKEHLLSGGERAVNMERVIQQMESPYKQTLLVNYREKIIPVKLAEVGLIYSSEGTVSLYLQDNRSFIVSYTLEQLELLLDPYQFFRANRQFIVNRDFIDDVESYFNRKLVIFSKVKSPEKIIVSRIKAQLFLKWLER
ncbi:LytTR family DNA-binding domain-containing protein [Pedobacter sp. MC2016-15]|uniref:LytR/AlgR family response regulator transcription factor n=1 Tax=Pedobacter sp. MC2016-15 TaxID=2994473 RepID=UPI002247863A|nr:LytTR family DNA-binding domain-containing protein [Pedobacter sp. MC2016-15]MCX2479074.1 LytTR family DNA-binding domain-containing protein [Pedobacter sp. MC2016-15]